MNRKSIAQEHVVPVWNQKYIVSIDFEFGGCRITKNLDYHAISGDVKVTEPSKGGYVVPTYEFVMGYTP